MVSAAPGPRNDTEHTPICCASKHSLVHTVTHTGLIVNIVSSVSVLQGDNEPKVQESKSGGGPSDPGGREWSASSFQGRVSRSAGPAMAGHRAFSTGTPPAEKVSGSKCC